MPSESEVANDEATSRRPVSPRAKIETIVISAAFALYAVFLLKLLLFSRQPGSERSINLIPFRSIASYLFTDSATVARFAFGNVVGNILVFVPLGACLAVLTRRSIATNMLVVAVVSVAVEIIQGVFGLGASDIDDVILNCLGGFLGVLVCKLLHTILRTWARVRTVIAVLSIAAVPVLVYLLFVIQLRM